MELGISFLRKVREDVPLSVVLEMLDKREAQYKKHSRLANNIGNYCYEMMEELEAGSAEHKATLAQMRQETDRARNELQQIERRFLAEYSK